jgi:hypothetical protein
VAGPAGSMPKATSSPCAASEIDRCAHRAREAGKVGDAVIGWVDGDHGRGIPFQRGERSERGCGRRAAPFGLEEHARALHAHAAQLLGGEEAVLLVRDHERGQGALQLPRTGDGFLQHAALRDQRQELLGQQLSRERPQARAVAAR